MKTLLLVSKHIALLEEANEISIEHIKKSIQSVTFEDDEIAQKIYGYLHLKNVKNETHVFSFDLDNVSLKPKVNFDTDAKEFINFLKNLGLNLRVKICSLYIDNSKLFAINSSRLLTLGKIKETLSQKIFDQDIAIECVKDAISRAIFDKREDSVKAILFFLGPPATGKTFLAEETGKILEDFGYVTKIFTMTTYTGAFSNLLGSDGLLGFEKGDLTTFIENNPKSLIVIDEIEKASIEIQQALFRVLDRGYIENKGSGTEGKTDAKESIFIFTSNLGKDVYERNNYTKLIQNQKETESLILQSIVKEKHEVYANMFAISTPLVSRLSAGDIILFNKVGLRAYFKMTKTEIIRYFSVIESTFGSKLKCSNEAILALFLHYLPVFDPRRLKGKIGDSLFNHIRDYLQKESMMLYSFESIGVTVSDEFKEFLQQNFVENFDSFSFKDERFLELIDKKETLFSDISFKRSKDILILVFSNPRIEKVKNIQDFFGDVKIELEIPSGKLEGDNKAKIYGHDDAKATLVRIASKMGQFVELRRKNDPNATEILKNIPKGILLYGPPGTGKTKIARAFAAQIELPIIVASGKDMTTHEVVGTGIKRIKDIFKKAREYAPSVLFIDEIDAVGIRGGVNRSDEQDKNINTLLEELDGFSIDAFKPVFVIAATNRLEKIDPAIIRPGRIEEHIEIGFLDKKARFEFTQDILLEEDCFSKDIEINKFLKYTAGMSGAQLEQVFKKARYNIEIKREELLNPDLLITMELLIEVVNEIRFGKASKLQIDGNFANTLIAVHEAGHAIVSMVTNPSVSIDQISIVPRSNAGGFVSYNFEDVARFDKEFMIGQIATAYGGRVAEELFCLKTSGSKYKGLSTGASEDIKQATKLIGDAVLKYGMDDDLGLISYDELNLSEHTKHKIDETIHKWQNEIKLTTQEVLNNNWDNLLVIVDALIGNDTDDGIETVDDDWIKKNINLNRSYRGNKN